MSVMTIDHGFFKDQAEVMLDIAKTGFWPTTFVSDVSPELPVHYHDYDIIGYVVNGSTYLLTEAGERIDIKAGDRLNIPKGAWHAEGEIVDTVTYIVSVSDPVAFNLALAPREPRGPWPEIRPPK